MPRPASSRKSQPARRPVAVSVKKTAKKSVAAAKAATARRTRANGAARSGYIPDDASFGKQTFEVWSSRLQAGCAESAIVNGLLSLIDSARGLR